MHSNPRLRGKNFGQQLDIVGPTIAEYDLSPNRMIVGAVVFEPMKVGQSGGIRITARDADHRVLWGFVACHEMLAQHHCPVAVYDTLRSLISEELAKHQLPVPPEVDPLQAAAKAIATLEEAVQGLKRSITVKKVSETTRSRATVVAKVARDANRMIALETSSFATGKRDAAASESD